MLGDMTLKGLSFVKVSANDNGLSLWRETSRGPTKPTELMIRNAVVKDNRSKRPAYQTTVTVDRYDELADGSIAVVETAYLTSRILQDTTVDSAEILIGPEVIVQLLTGTAADGSALDKRSAIFVTREQ